jgi:arylsulfatase
MDWVPTLMAAVGEDDIGAKLLEGHSANGRDYRVHLDGFNMLPMLTGETTEGPRDHFFYVSDDGLVLGIRKNDWKLVFAEQRASKFDVWRDPFIELRGSKIFHLRRDPFERADTDSNNYNRWWIERAAFVLSMVHDDIVNSVLSLQEFPQRQSPGSFNMQGILERVQAGMGASD